MQIIQIVVLAFAISFQTSLIPYQFGKYFHRFFLLWALLMATIITILRLLFGTLGYLGGYYLSLILLEYSFLAGAVVFAFLGVNTILIAYFIKWYKPPEMKKTFWGYFFAIFSVASLALFPGFAMSLYKIEILSNIPIIMSIIVFVTALIINFAYLFTLKFIKYLEVFSGILYLVLIFLLFK